MFMMLMLMGVFVPAAAVLFMFVMMFVPHSQCSSCSWECS